MVREALGWNKKSSVGATEEPGGFYS